MTQTAAASVPGHADIESLRRAAVNCGGCELWKPATQVVFSAGNPQAPLALVGEQPGDLEDRKGIPFVGPAGRLLQDALKEAGVPPSPPDRLSGRRSESPAVWSRKIESVGRASGGQVLELATPIGVRRVLATVHPSAVLRASGKDWSAAFAGLVADLRTARKAVA